MKDKYVASHIGIIVCIAALAAGIGLGAWMGLRNATNNSSRSTSNPSIIFPKRTPLVSPPPGPPHIKNPSAPPPSE